MIQVEKKDVKRWMKRGFVILGIVNYIDKQVAIMAHHTESIMDKKD